MPPTRSARSSNPLRGVSSSIVSAAIAVVVDVFYLVLVLLRDESFTSRHVFVSLDLLVIAGVLVAASRVKGVNLRAILLAGAANSLILIGFLGLFSIGLPLIIAGLISMPALGRALADAPNLVGAALVGLGTFIGAGVIIAGLLATQ